MWGDSGGTADDATEIVGPLEKPFRLRMTVLSLFMDVRPRRGRATGRPWVVEPVRERRIVGIARNLSKIPEIPEFLRL